MLLTRDSSKFRLVDCLKESNNNPIHAKNCLDKHIEAMKADNVTLTDYFKANYAKYC